MKTMYEKLKKILSTRGCVKINSNNGKFVIERSYKGEWVMEGKFWGPDNMDEEDSINFQAKKQNWKIIDVFDTPQERFKAGDEVVWVNGKFGDMVGKIEEYIGLNNYYVKFGRWWKTLAHNQLSYPFQEEKKDIGSDNFEITYTPNSKPENLILNGKKYKLTEIK